MGFRTAKELLRAEHEWWAHARPSQRPVVAGVPANWLVLGGRGAGKTRLGAEWVNAHVRGYPPFARQRYGQIALVGETLADVREVMIEGPSGIVASSRRDRPRYEPSRRRLIWSSGAVASVFSSEDPDSLRGPQFSAAWCDARTIWASAVTVLSAAGALLGLPVGGLDGGALTDSVLQAVTAISGIIAIFGRMSATTRIA